MPTSPSHSSSCTWDGCILWDRQGNWGGCWRPTCKVYFYPRWEILGFSIFGWLIQLYISFAQEDTHCSMPEYIEWLTPWSFSKDLLLRNRSQEAEGRNAVKRPTQRCLHICNGHTPEVGDQVKWSLFSHCFIAHLGINPLKKIDSQISNFHRNVCCKNE